MGLFAMPLHFHKTRIEKGAREMNGCGNWWDWAKSIWVKQVDRQIPDEAVRRRTPWCGINCLCPSCVAKLEAELNLYRKLKDAVTKMQQPEIPLSDDWVDTFAEIDKEINAALQAIEEREK